MPGVSLFLFPACAADSIRLMTFRSASHPALAVTSLGLFRLSPFRESSHRYFQERHRCESHFAGNRAFLFSLPSLSGYRLASVELYQGERTFLTLSSVSCPRAFTFTEGGKRALLSFSVNYHNIVPQGKPDNQTWIFSAHFLETSIVAKPSFR